MAFKLEKSNPFIVTDNSFNPLDNVFIAVAIINNGSAILANLSKSDIISFPNKSDNADVIDPANCIAPKAIIDAPMDVIAADSKNNLSDRI